MKTVAIELTRIAAGIALLTSLALSCTYKDFVAAVEAQHQAAAKTAIVMPVNMNTLPNS